MSNNFRLIQAGSVADHHYITSMHRLRYAVFCEELKWSYGLHCIENMEFDEYDEMGTNYIVSIDEDDEVEAACRIIPTVKPYMIEEHYSEFVEKISIPKSANVWEMSRFCASNKARQKSKGKISGQLIAASIEFGLLNGISNYIALVTDYLIPYMRRIAGWDPTLIGERRKTPDDFSYCVLYSVNDKMLHRIRERNHIRSPLLFDSDCRVTWKENEIAA